MKRTTAAAFLVIALATLSGCTGTGEPTSLPTVDPDEQAVSAIRWEGGTTNPKLVFEPPLRVSQATIGVIESGDGGSISMGQLVTFDTLVVDGETGSVETSTFSSGTPDQLIVSPNTANTTMLAAMQSAKVGARFLYVVPDPQVTSTASPAPDGGNSGAVASKVIAIAIRSVADLPTKAEGEVKTPDPALPTVNFDGQGQPTLAKPTGEPSDELVSGVLIEGTGPVVGEGQTLAVKYYGWLWDGTVFDSAWGEGYPLVFNLNDVISGWSKGIVGKKVGSRVLMVVPPALAYGGSGQASIPPDSTLVFLVDVLAAY